MVKHGKTWVFSMRNWIFAQLNVENNNMNTCGFDGETCCFSLQKDAFKQPIRSNKEDEE
jgi:hypothetical protein